MPPTRDPTISPSQSPTLYPSANPSYSPSTVPTHAPSTPPTAAPTYPPTNVPSNAPSFTPTKAPSFAPSIAPTPSPTLAPSSVPSSSPTNTPSNAPSSTPSSAPSFSPSFQPTSSPTSPPTLAPSVSPSRAPSQSPSTPPTIAPSYSPSNVPSISPTQPPTKTPTQTPTVAPSYSPSLSPSLVPTSAPSRPTINPTHAPSPAPSFSPTQSPSSPTKPPTFNPTSLPTPIWWPLLCHGYNAFTNEPSIYCLMDDGDYVSNLHRFSNYKSECNYDKIEFGSVTDSYYENVESISTDIAVRFGLGTMMSVGPGISETQEIVQSQSITSWQWYFNLDLQCIVAEATMVDYPNIYWNEAFLHDIIVLPSSFSNSNLKLNLYEAFWKKYGTHFVQTAEFGGIIHSTVTAARCEVQEVYETSEEYKTCLSQYVMGVENEQCSTTRDTQGSTVQANEYIKYQSLTITGGKNLGSIITMFDETRRLDKASVNAWIDSLDAMEDVTIVGGKLVAIHELIQRLILDGSHHLNELDDMTMDGDGLYQIASAMEQAYVAYAQQLNSTSFQCEVNCYSGNVDDNKCKCIECGEDECCGYAVTKEKQKETQNLTGLWVFLVFFVLSIIAALVYFYYYSEKKGNNYGTVATIEF
eukprot:315833_1